MMRREQRNEFVHATWLGGLTLSAMLGTFGGPWLWLPVAVAATRGLELATMWTRVWAMRRRRARTGRMLLLAAVPRSSVHIRQDKPVSWEESLITGCLEISPDTWLWRPPFLASEFTCLSVPQSGVSGVVFTPARDPGMPAGCYVQIGTKGGKVGAFLVWDHHMLPPVWSWAGGSTRRGVGNESQDDHPGGSA
jgi:hypothetical protein